MTLEQRSIPNANDSAVLPYFEIELKMSSEVAVALMFIIRFIGGDSVDGYFLFGFALKSDIKVFSSIVPSSQSID